MATFLSLLKKAIKCPLALWYQIRLHVYHIKKNIIVFESSMGRNYTGNPKYIYEEMLRQGLANRYKIYFSVQDTSIKIPGPAKKIKRGRFLFYHIMAVAGIWISDSRLPEQLRKRKGVTYIQTWHGTPLKKLALDMEQVCMANSENIDTYKQSFYKNTRTWDYLLSQNHFSSETFQRCFAFHKTILEIGYPRNDILFTNNNTPFISELKSKLGLPSDKKIILYAPTWRDDEYDQSGNYKFSAHLDFEYAKQELSEKYIFLVKYHYIISDQLDWSGFQGFVYPFSADFDIANLYLVSDYLVTDYSSVMFDYSLLHRPMLFYAYDLDTYKHNLRGFYFNFEKNAPGPISQTTEELIQDIKEYQWQDYEQKYQRFASIYNHADDGKASQKIVTLIEELQR